MKKMFMKRVLFLLVIMMLVTMTVSCGLRNETTSSDDTKSETSVNKDSGEVYVQSDSINQEPQNPDDIPFIEIEGDTYEIPTPYCNLQYPISWKDYIQLDTLETEDYYEVKFTALIEGNSIPLYSIILGDIEIGHLIGTVINETLTFDVRFLNYTEDSVPQMSDEGNLMYYQMGEDINVIISKLVYDCGMELSN